MDDRYARLESAVDQLRSTVQSLQQRIEALETGRAEGARAATEPMPASVAAVARPRRDPYDPIVVLSLVGRLFLVLAGGFFLRAMTEAGVLAAAVGVGLAFVYALVWLALADRACRTGQSSAALFHAIAAAIVAFPLLVEATTRFKVIGVAGSVLGLVFLTVLFMAVATRRRVHAIAWITVVAALPTAVVLLLKTSLIAPFALYLIAFGVATLWLAYTLGWTLLRWPVALVADLAVAGLALRAITPAHAESTRIAMVMQLLLVAAYLGTIAIRTLLRGRKVTLFEIVQTSAALLVGFGGAILLARSATTMPLVMGFASVVFGAACYAVAFAFIDRHEDLARNVYFYTTLGLVLVLSGLTLDLRQQWLGVVLAALGVLAMAAWLRYGRLYMLLHGAAYVVAAGIASHVLGYAARALTASPTGPWPVPDASMVAVVVAVAVAASLAAARPHPQGGGTANGVRLVVSAVLVWAASGCATGYLGPPAAGSTDLGVDLGALATVRTGVLAGATLLVAWAARRPRFHEWAWLVYPLLVFIGLKMVAQDFKYSRPATLFIALALYGIALIVAPRLKRRRDGSGLPPKAPDPAVARSGPAQST